MPVYRIICPYCQQKREISFLHQGLDVECPTCKKKYQVPSILQPDIISFGRCKYEVVCPHCQQKREISLACACKTITCTTCKKYFSVPPLTKYDTIYQGRSEETNLNLSCVIGTFIGAILGIPASYFFQNEVLRVTVGGVGGYLGKFNILFERLSWEMGVPQNLFIGIAIFAVIGAIFGFVISKLPSK